MKNAFLAVSLASILAMSGCSNFAGPDRDAVIKAANEGVCNQVGALDCTNFRSLGDPTIIMHDNKSATVNFMGARSNVLFSTEVAQDTEGVWRPVPK